MIRGEIHVVMYLKCVGCDVGFEGSGGNVFLESVRVYFGRVGVGRSVCFWEEVGVATSGELEFG